MEKSRVLITSVFLRPDDDVDRRLREVGCAPVYHPLIGKRTEEELIALLQGIDGAIASVDPFTDRVLAAAPQLKVISRTGVGYADSPLRALDNVYLTPHAAGSTADARERSGTMAADNLIRALRGERPAGIVNPEVLTR
jgi:phosphoglycerate dehydrogenase-like enzyme